MKLSCLGSALCLVTFASEHHVAFGGSRKTKLSKKESLAPSETPHPNPPEMELKFPSPENVHGSIFDSTFFLPPLLAPLYPEFTGPHFAVDSFPNECKYGVDKIVWAIELGESPNMPDANMIGLTFSINNIEVAEETISGSHTYLTMDDVIFPPITDPELNIKLEVSFFDGKVISNNREWLVPGGINITASAGGLTLNCAPPFPIKGERVGTGAIREAKKPETIGIINEYAADLRHCECDGPVQVLPATSRSKIFPKDKKYSACNDYSGSFLPVLDEPFKVIDPTFNNVFSFSGYKLKADTSAFMEKSETGKKNKDDEDTAIGTTNKKGKKNNDDEDTAIGTTIEHLYNEVCGGSGQEGFVRLTGCECEEVPLAFDPNDLILDFEVYCPLSVLPVMVR
jgi:hypothetical protein